MKLLAKKHEGMKIGADGILGRIRDGRHHKQLNYSCGVMLRHLEEMASRFYAGDPSAVDEFLQLYCLDDARPECTCDAEEMPFGRCCKVAAQQHIDGSYCPQCMTMRPFHASHCPLSATASAAQQQKAGGAE